MYKQLVIMSFLIGVFFVKLSISRPISYPDGWTIMQMNDFNRHSLHVHLSPSVNYSVGYRGEYWRKKEWQFHGTQINYLIKRFNTSKSQANFYIKSGVGVAVSDYKNLNNKFEPNVFTGISADWEDRQYYISYQNRMNYNSSIDTFFLQKARIGFAPYVGDYGDLHTWVMLQVENMSKTKNEIIYTPMLRMFKGDFLAEVGLTNYKDFMFNFIKRF